MAGNKTEQLSTMRYQKRSHSPFYLCLPSAGVIGVHHHAWSALALLYWGRVIFSYEGLSSRLCSAPLASPLVVMTKISPDIFKYHLNDILNTILHLLYAT